ncbi:hypothetical protein MBLNU457_7672t2 [Dothideomycetes sp. NU457]
MSDTTFPMLFTVNTSSRHDVLLLSPNTSIPELTSRIESLIASSPNCQQALDKYSKNQNPYEVKSIKVRWSGEPREARLWPSATTLTEDNVQAVLELVRLHQGRDILEVEAVQGPVKEEKEKEGEGESELPERRK